MKTTRPASTPSAAAYLDGAAAEAKAGEEHVRNAPVTPPAPDGLLATRPESTSPAGAQAAVAGAKAGEEHTPVPAPKTLPAPGESQTTRTTSKSPTVDLSTGAAGTKAGEEPHGHTPAPVTRPASYGSQTAGTETTPTASVPVTPTARLLLPADAPVDVWRGARQQGIGGSDVAAILGMDGHGGALRVWLEKTGQARPDRDTRLERSARRGHALEGLVAEFFGEESGLTVLNSPGTLQHVDHPHWIANPDRLTAAPGADSRDELGVLECKTRTWRSAHVENWRGNEAPDGPALQAHWYMTVTGLRFAYVAGLIDDDLTWFRLERDDELSGMLADAVDRFWRDHVLAGLPPKPDGTEATTELLARLWDAREEATVEVDPVETAFLKQRRSVLKARMSDLADELGTVENRMRQLAGEAEVAIVGGQPAFTWRANGQFAHARFREAEPELAAEYTCLVPAVDAKRLEAEHPETYRKYRARVLRVPSEG